MGGKSLDMAIEALEQEPCETIKEIPKAISMIQKRKIS